MTNYEIPLHNIHEPINVPGWVDGRICEYLEQESKDKIVINMGIWKGRSTAVMAEHADIVYAIDHFRGSPSERDTNHKQAKDDPLSVFREFWGYMAHLKLTDKIIPMCLESYQAVEYFYEDYADLIFLDGSHDFEDVAGDLIQWYPILKEGGIFCGDDYNWGGVQDAVDLFVKTNGLDLEVEFEEKFWRFRKV